MSDFTPRQLVEFLTRNQFLGKSDLAAIAQEVDRHASAEPMIEDLVNRGLLTQYQQTHLLNGQGDKLVIGPYRLIEPLGEGGMGTVVKGFQPRLERIVALKLIHTNPFTFRPEIVARFNREARAIAKLQHPNIVVLFDAGEVDDTHYIAMEFINGVNLEKMVRQDGPLAVKQACDYMRQAALGLQHAAECGLVHRDIKPSNILVAQKSASGQRSSAQLKRPELVTIRARQLASGDPSPARLDDSWGDVKILDMGLARLWNSLEGGDPNQNTPLTRVGTLLGTPDFISPEQARDARSVDIRSDLYSLGCTFYYVLAGRTPFAGGTTMQKLARHAAEQPYPIDELRPHLPTFVVDVIQRLMAKKPEKRFQTPGELAGALANYLASTLPSKPPPRGSTAVDRSPSTPPQLPSVPLATRAEGFDSVDSTDMSASPTKVMGKVNGRAGTEGESKAPT